MRTSRTLLALVALGVAVLAAPRRAEANGRFPAAQQVIVGPGTRSSTLAVRTTFGFAVSDDAGRSFHWLCEDALGLPPSSPFDAPYAMAADGALLVGRFDGLTWLGPDRCSTSNQPAVDGAYLGDLDQDATGNTIVLVTSAGGTVMNRVYRSSDGGRTFAPLGTGVANVLFDTLEMARTDLNRIYLSGDTLNPTAAVMFRSDDGGATLQSLDFPIGASLQNAYVAAVDPTDRDRVYVRGNMLVMVDAGTTAQETVLLQSTDAGVSWREIARTQSPMTGFAISDDGRTLWMGTSDVRDGMHGLWRSDDAGVTWTLLGQQHVLGLRQHAGVLYMAANFVTDGFALGRSDDRGATFAPLLQFGPGNAGGAVLSAPVACSSGPAAMCGGEWPAVQSMFVNMDGGFDASADVVGSSERSGGSGCHCRGGPASGRSNRWMFTVLATVACAWTRRRPRR